MSISCAGNCGDHSSTRIHIVSPESSYFCLHAVLVALPGHQICCLHHTLHTVTDHAILMQTYMLKLAKSGEDGEKAFLVLESGSRFHTTQVLVHDIYKHNCKKGTNHTQAVIESAYIMQVMLL